VLVDQRTIEIEVTFVASGAGTTVTVEQRGLDKLPAAEADHVRRFGFHLLLAWFRDHLNGEDHMAATATDVTFGGVSPYLYYADANAALDWLARVFGFVEIARYVDADDVVKESEMRVGRTEIQICGRQPGENEGTGLLLIVHVDDVDAMHARVVAAGVDAQAPEQQSYGPRTFGVDDPWGYRWLFWQHVHDYVAEPGGLREIRAEPPSPRGT
jgi:uncharacterized glyoxalase superfamily protein PhnB